MRFRSTIIAVILAALSAAAAWYVWTQSAADEAAPAEGPRRLFRAADVPVDDVNRVTLSRAGAEPMVFERRAGEWRQIEPVDYPVEVFSMRQFAIAVQELETVGQVREGAGGVSLESLSLDPPLATLTLEWSGGSTTLRLGRRGVGGLAYLQVAGDDAVHLVRQDLHERAIDQSPFEWRRKRLFEYAGVESSQVVFDEPGALGYHLERERRRWTMTSPYLARLDSAAMDEHLAFIASVQPAAFIADAPEDLAQFGLADPQAVMTVSTPVSRIVEGEAQQQVMEERLLIGAPRQMEPSAPLYAMMEGRQVVFTLPRQIVQQLAASRQLIDLRAMTVNPADIRSIRITAGDVEFTISRDGEDPTRWVDEEGEGVTVDQVAVQRLLATLTEIRATDAQVGEFPFAQAAGLITVFGYSGEPLTAARIARLEDGRSLVFSDDQILRIYPATVEINLAADAYRVD